MPDQVYKLSPWEEHSFWLEIIQDHVYFLRDHLSPAERNWVTAAEQYLYAFDLLRRELSRLPREGLPSDPELIRFASEARTIAEGYYQLEAQVQQLRIRNAINVNLSPTYFNGTLLENGEYIRLLSYYQQGQTPPDLPVLSLLELWLEDQLGHALLLRNIIDPIELSTIQRSEEFARIFQGFQAQTRQLAAYYQKSNSADQRLEQLALQVGQAVIRLNAFILEVTAGFKGHSILSRTTLRFLEHHFPESCYFLKKLSLYAPSLEEASATCSLHKPSFQ